MTTRKVGSTLYQGNDEEIVYSLTTTAWGSTPTSVSVKAYEISTGARTDVSSTVLSGTASVNGDIITLPVLKSLTAGNVYRVEVKFTSGSNVYEPYFDILAEY